MSSTAAIALLFPGSFLDPVWRLNPRAQIAFASMGGWAPVLLGAVSVACASAAVGLWRVRLWGYVVAIALLVINGIGDVVNVVLGTEPRAVIGIPIVIALVLYLTRPSVRAVFERK